MAKKNLRFIYTAYMLTGDRRNRQKRRVTVALGSIRQDEFFLAKREGLKPKAMIYVHSVDYKEEELIEFKGSVMSVYRTYPNEETGLTEIYLLEKAGEQ